MKQTIYCDKQFTVTNKFCKKNAWQSSGGKGFAAHPADAGCARRHVRQVAQRALLALLGGGGALGPPVERLVLGIQVRLISLHDQSGGGAARRAVTLRVGVVLVVELHVVGALYVGLEDVLVTELACATLDGALELAGLLVLAFNMEVQASLAGEHAVAIVVTALE